MITGRAPALWGDPRRAACLPASAELFLPPKEAANPPIMLRRLASGGDPTAMHNTRIYILMRCQIATHYCFTGTVS
jgi:hypothetical protein